MLKVFDHPLIRHKLTIMRDKNTSSKDFRQNLNEIASLMVFEITRDFPVTIKQVDTPLCSCKGYELSRDIVIAPILRAGLGLVQGIQDLIPTAKIAHIGMYRDEKTLLPKPYFEKYPSNINDALVLIVDPMLATGGSSIAAIDRVKMQGAKDIRLVCLVGSPEGVEAVTRAHPDVDIYLAALDDHLNEHGYIVPGLGDAGDRIFGTK
ncbi:uracil phosphoribosyltransferase [Faecalicoccus acidiformans]|uniref:Uracil phosphoribosyltransferase n=1 Tax=Faecalicoccus acidiformans TaxID=915173 RepID=A0A7W8D1N3_9FIRM|nr:uracil phosphoribosyltransferase [Faecalicoccus acidiformans]MBB5185114.1 uracil phosphoribosyltransferase [Faecalicoccus acidiformans]MBM6830573.1 uracil phosphoribosyltransferase [Faecalicoccus acidiformans]MDM8203013.1 uracil phosphoribosyltransferase [Faecalicoccus acidiformans]